MIAAVRLLLLTGARLSEILTLRWEHVDLEGRCLNLSDSKTGAKTIHLNAPALQVLAGLPQETDWALPGRYGKHGRRSARTRRGFHGSPSEQRGGRHDAAMGPLLGP